MAVFTYEAKNLSGKKITGTMEAIDRSYVIDSLRSRDYFVISVREKNKFLYLEVDDLRNVSLKDIVIMCRQLSFLLNSGINILKGLKLLRDQIENKRLKKVISYSYDEMRRGMSLSEAFSKNEEIPEMLVNMIAVGETSGNLDIIMERMAKYYENHYKQSQKIKSAMIYPAVISVFAITVVLALVTYIMPTVISSIVTEGGTLPVTTRILIGISDFLKSYGIAFLIGIILLCIVLRIYVKNSYKIRKFLHKHLLHIPLIGKVNTKILVARFARTFAVLISSGIPLIKSIEVCADALGNLYLKTLLREVKEDIKKGGGIGVSLQEQGVFPKILSSMISIGEESGTLDEILEKTADFYDNEVETAITRLITLLEPLIIVILAFIVGFIVISIIVPIYDMMDY